jgi:hypothetical protein
LGRALSHKILHIFPQLQELLHSTSAPPFSGFLTFLTLQMFSRDTSLSNSGAILVITGYVLGQLVFVTLQANNKLRWHFSIRHVEFYKLVRSTAFYQYLTCGVYCRSEYEIKTISKWQTFSTVLLPHRPKQTQSIPVASAACREKGRTSILGTKNKAQNRYHRLQGKIVEITPLPSFSYLSISSHS